MLRSLDQQKKLSRHTHRQSLDQHKVLLQVGFEIQGVHLHLISLEARVVLDSLRSFRRKWATVFDSDSQEA